MFPLLLALCCSDTSRQSTGVCGGYRVQHHTGLPGLLHHTASPAIAGQGGKLQGATDTTDHGARITRHKRKVEVLKLKLKLVWCRNVCVNARRRWLLNLSVCCAVSTSPAYPACGSLTAGIFCCRHTEQSSGCHAPLLSCAAQVQGHSTAQHTEDASHHFLFFS